MNQYFYGFFTAICLSISFVMFTASKSSDLGDITVNSIRVVDNQNGGFITTYNRLGELTTFICLLYTSPSPRDVSLSRMPSSA